MTSLTVWLLDAGRTSVCVVELELGGRFDVLPVGFDVDEGEAMARMLFGGEQM